MIIQTTFRCLFTFIFLFTFSLSAIYSQGENMPPIQPWQEVDREVRYMPEEDGFVITNGTRRFNRALYGDHSDFRVEAGDLPEFSSYLPGMGGNMKFALVWNDQSKWLIEANTITARYHPGKMLYTITDEWLGEGSLTLEVIPFASADGFSVQTQTEGIPGNLELIWVYGGVSGKRFTRNGDIGADPESVFYLHPEYCTSNEFYIEDNRFRIYFGGERKENQQTLLSRNDLKNERLSDKRKLTGWVPPSMNLKLSDAQALDDPLTCYQTAPNQAPILVGTMKLERDELSFFALNMETDVMVEKYSGIQDSMFRAETKRRALTSRIRVNTPDPFLNNLGEALAVAADAVYKDPVFLHGAVAWRNPLPGWRAAYIGDWLGWHGRARKHFDAYLEAQYLEPDSAFPAPDPETNLARQIEKKGYGIFSEGYISRNPGRISDPHHYDMNLVFFDQLLWHIQWSGDLEYARQIWPSIQRHLAWEKRNFDADDDGLYDAYACIWSSDALQYSSGGVTYSSAYNYRGNKLAAVIAKAIGADPKPYEQEASRILNAINTNLWIPELGWYAEYKDFLGHQRLHKYPGVWSIYHSIDSEVPDQFQAYQALRYIDTEIPKIPIEVAGFPSGYHTISSTSWMPYEWSVNNVALAEVLHTSLANWQGNRPEQAFHLWKSALLESMYLGASPGNFQQLSFYDAFRGELYRDFSDAIGVASRTLVEGLFGIIPQALDHKLYLKPGFPQEWEHASLNTPDFDFSFQRNGKTSVYKFESRLNSNLQLVFQPQARFDDIASVTVNGRDTDWSAIDSMVGQPRIEITASPASAYIIEIQWNGHPIDYEKQLQTVSGGTIIMQPQNQQLIDLRDPQNALVSSDLSSTELRAEVANMTGNKTFFAQTRQGAITWWKPVNMQVKKPVDVWLNKESTGIKSSLTLKNNRDEGNQLVLSVNQHKNPYQKTVVLAPGDALELNIPDEHWLPGSNTIALSGSDWTLDTVIMYWQQRADETAEWEIVDLASLFNDKVDNIFSNDYRSPRSPYPTLQVPTHGFGDWCSFNARVEIDDNGLRRTAGANNQVATPLGIPFKTTGSSDGPNIIYTSLWDNYPGQAEIALTGHASHAYLLMAGSTNHMQSRFVNGVVTITYKDGTHEKLELINPGTWWPIEQDYYIDGYAFHVETPRPPRIYLKTGKMIMEPYDVLSRNHTVKIDGGAATVLDIPLDPSRELSSLKLETLANEVVIGLMGITLMR